MPTKKPYDHRCVLFAIESREREKHAEAIKEHKSAGEILDMERKLAKDSAKKLMAEGRRDAALAAVSRFAVDPPSPVSRGYIVNDATVEKLGELRESERSTAR